jgi:cellulose synthase/poly-beta-1,6-N-acetylglucosamine synthase-like glycosyltransferase
VLAAFFTVAGLAYLAVASRTGTGARKYVIGAVLLGLGVGAKLTPALAMPAVLRRRPFLVAGTVAGTFAAVYLPHVLAVGAKVIGFIPGYVQQQGYSHGNGYMLLSLVLPNAWTGGAAALILAGTALAVLRYADPYRPWRSTLVLTGVTLFVTTPVFAWYPVLLCALVALDGRVEWLALGLAVYINTIGQTLGLGLIAAQRVGYGLALLVVLATTYYRYVQRRRRATRELIGEALALTITTTAASEETAVPLVDVVLPCLDEAGALPYVLGRMPEGYRAIVVDNGSTDGSAVLAAELGALVVTEKRRGFGAACHAGLAAATAPVVCFCDCDGSLDPLQLPRVAGPVLDRESDLVLGRRRPVTSGAWPPHARIANQVLAFRLRRPGVQVKDLGPMRAARREALLGLGVTDRRSGYPLETVLAAARAGWQITETDVDYAPRTGKSKVTGTLTGTLQAVRDMNRVWKEATR